VLLLQVYMFMMWFLTLVLVSVSVSVKPRAIDISYWMSLFPRAYIHGLSYWNVETGWNVSLAGFCVCIHMPK
jgi:hypothetical protein